MESNTQEKRVLSFKARQDLHAWLKKRAESEYRSVSAQIVLILDAARQQETRSESAQ